MSRPVVGDYAEDLYARLEPIHRDTDEAAGWPLLTYIGGLGAAHDLVRYITADTDEQRGWSALFDPDRCPADFLPYLGQYFGVRIPVGTPEALARDMIKTPAGFVRCSEAAVIAAVKSTLTGAQYVNFVTRQDDSFWRWLITTRPAETPNAALTYRAILSQKRAGVIATHVVTDETLIDELEGTVDELAGDVDDL